MDELTEREALTEGQKRLRDSPLSHILKRYRSGLDLKDIKIPVAIIEIFHNPNNEKEARSENGFRERCEEST